MLRKILTPALAATVLLTACADTSTSPPTSSVSDDYAVMMFGEAGSALQGTMGPQDGPRPFDGRTCWPSLPEALQLTEEQLTAIQDLRMAFRAEHEDELEALKAVFMDARAARTAGATREEVRAILLEGREIAMGLRLDVIDLHIAIWNVLTDEQKAWLIEHRPRRFPPPIAHG